MCRAVKLRKPLGVSEKVPIGPYNMSRHLLDGMSTHTCINKGVHGLFLLPTEAIEPTIMVGASWQLVLHLRGAQEVAPHRTVSDWFDDMR